MADIFDLFKKIASERPQEAVMPVSYIVAGLGNPGSEYSFTRHNTGFLALDYISQKLDIKVDRLKFKALCGEKAVSGKRVLFMKPQTYMNSSGEAVREAAAFYKIPPENILVIFDDISLPVGRIRVRQKGSDGGHNGIKSITEELSSCVFPRIKIGVGDRPNREYDLADWVLSGFTDDEKKTVFGCFGCAYEGMLKIIAGDSEGAVALCNSYGAAEKTGEDNDS